MRFLIFVLLFIPSILFAEDLSLPPLKLPPGFNIQVYAYPVPGARSMAMGPKDVIFVGSRMEGKVYAIIPDTKAHYKTRIVTIASDLNQPNGVAYQDGALFVAEIHRVLRFDNIMQHLDNTAKYTVINENLPSDTQHGWRYIGFGPDKKLYIAIGMPCNVCRQKDKRFGTIARMNADGSQFEIFAEGIRNSVGFDWHPTTHELWFTDNGRDWLGNRMPPDEVNLAPHSNMHFGFPYYDGHLVDEDYIKPSNIKVIFPQFELPAHVAALSIKFYTGNMFPSEYNKKIFIAEHGSWNSTEKVGYQVVMLTLNGNNVTNATPFITGWLDGNNVWGRPVDILMMNDGSMLISDDHRGAIYRVTYKN